MLSATVPVPDWLDKRDIEAEAKKLRALRAALGWSQDKIARRLGITTRAYSRWETAAVRCQLAALELLEILVEREMGERQQQASKKPAKPQKKR